MSGTHDLAEIAADGATFRLFNEVAFAEVPATVPVFPKPGTYKHGSYGNVTLTPERVANFVTNFNNGVYQKHIPIDAEHKSKLSGALGYISKLVVQDDGRVDAAVDWTDRGSRLVANDRFKYVSPEWFDRWEQPDTEVEFQDVLVGLALTTRPFFKDANDSLRPLVAREGELIAPPTQEGAGDDKPMSEPTVKPKGQTMEFTEQQFTELKDQVSDLTRKFTDADAARIAAEADAKTFSDRVAKLEADRQDRDIRDRVKAFAFSADVEHHVDMLKALPEDKREAYIAKEAASATALKNSKLFTEIGSDAGAPNDRAESKIATKAKALAEQKGISYEMAFSEVLTTDRDLARRYVTERSRVIDNTEE